MIGLDAALDRLLHRRSCLDAFLAGEDDGLDLAPDDRDALASVDRGELARTAARLREDLLRREHRGSGGLLALYPRTIAAWRAAHPGDADLVGLADAFLESGPGDAYREIPFAGAGLSLEEAFFRFAEERSLGDPAAREAELLAAMIKALAMSPRPDFTLPEAVRRTPRGFFAVSARSGPVLWATADGRFVTGPITPFLAALLTSTEAPGEVARRHAVAPAVLEASLAHLAALGLGIR